MVKLVNKLDTKNGPFDPIIFIGDLGDGPDPNSSKVIYYTEGKRPAKVYESMHYLGQIGVMKLANGLTLGFVTGQIDLVSDEILSLKFDKHQLDILITYQWPKIISDEQCLTTVGSPKLDRVLSMTKPRYWFAVGNEAGRYFEREPFAWDRHHQQMTRFISLAAHGSKEKWIYAFNLSADPSEDAKSVEQFGQIPSRRQKRQIEQVEQGKRAKQKVAPSSCFFCLSNPKVELHMIVSIGQFAYMTIAKGPLTTSQPLGFAGHGLIIPIDHYATLRQYRDRDEPGVPVQDTKLYREMGSFKESVLKMYQLMGCSVVYWEISKSTGVHFHTQFVPIPAGKTDEFETFLEKQIDFSAQRYGEKMAYSIVTDEELYHTIDQQDYMLITVAGSKKIHYLFKLNGSAADRLDLQFPRKVVAFLLHLGKRIRWDRCKGTISEESKERDAFKQKFKPFDFTI